MTLEMSAGSERPSPRLHFIPMSGMAKAQPLQRRPSKGKITTMVVGGPACRQKWMEVHQACLSQRKSFFISLEQEGLGNCLFEGGDVGPVRVSVKSQGARIPRSEHTLSQPAWLPVPPAGHTPSSPTTIV